MDKTRNKMKDLTMEDIVTARDDYLESDITPPTALGLNYLLYSGWRVTFGDESRAGQTGEGSLSDDTTVWCEDKDKVLKIFFSCDPDLIDLSGWDSSWNEE